MDLVSGAGGCTTIVSTPSVSPQSFSLWVEGRSKLQGAHDLDPNFWVLSGGWLPQILPHRGLRVRANVRRVGGRTTIGELSRPDPVALSRPFSL